MRHVLTCLGVATLLLAMLAPAARGAKEKVAPDKVPAAVMDAVKARFKDAEVLGASKEAEDGKVVYEVEIKHQGAHTNVSLTPEGTILLIEKEIPAKDLPAAAAEAMEEKYPKATRKMTEEVTKVEKKEEKVAYYEALLVTTDKKTVEVEVSAEGKILKEENKTGKDAD